MGIIILEGVLFVAVIAVAGALLIYGVRYFTPVGRRLQQTANRRRIERAAELVCPIHGLHCEQELVRLQDGTAVCPECYQEIVNGKLD